MPHIAMCVEDCGKLFAQRSESAHRISMIEDVFAWNVVTVVEGG